MRSWMHMIKRVIDHANPVNSYLVIFLRRQWWMGNASALAEVLGIILQFS